VTIFSTAGVLFGGRFGDRLTKQGRPDAKMRVGFLGMAWGAVFAVIMLAFFAFTSAPINVFVVLMACICFATAVPYGAATAAVQEMTPGRMRATFSAFFLFVVNLLGLGGGPFVVGLLNDKLFHDPNQVHLSLGITLVLATGLSAVLLYSGLKAFAKSIENAKIG